MKNEVTNNTSTNRRHRCTIQSSLTKV